MGKRYKGDTHNNANSIRLVAFFVAVCHGTFAEERGSITVGAGEGGPNP